LLFGLTAFFLEAWFWLCSRHFFNWKLMNFHIIQAWVRQMAARQDILRGGRHILRSTKVKVALTWEQEIKTTLKVCCKSARCETFKKGTSC